MSKSTKSFQTNYKTQYTELNLSQNSDKFMSKYSIDALKIIISGKSRAGNIRYKSRLG